VVIGAHYDTVRGSPGANDNASGVAALLELARLLKEFRPKREIRLVAFVNEEQPFFATEGMGSWRYAKRCASRGESVSAMLSLETIGYYSDQPGSQHYPFPFGLFYPSRGNFIAFVGNLRSGMLVRKVVESFRRNADFPSEAVAAPGWMTGIGWSDHWAFWKEGYPALMVTDTALFRYAEYHTSADTHEVVDVERTARVVHGLAAVIRDLAEERG
jgi:Zn-dependent M28 family amino/carboxypeptidase